MALAADLGIVETDRLTAVVSAASAVTAAAISIADSCTLITGFIYCTLGNFVIANSYAVYLLSKPNLPPRPILLPFTLNQAPLASSPL